jgi:hypothetical protein
LRLASVTICLIVIASFVIFAVNQTKSASTHQQAVLAENGTASQPASKHEGGLHRTIDDVSAELTSPFAGIVSGSSSEWTTRTVKLLLALLIYGFGLGYLARVVRVRV